MKSIESWDSHNSPNDDREIDGYAYLGGEQVDNAWVDTYIATDPDGTSWLRVVVDRDGYGSHTIDSDHGIEPGNEPADEDFEAIYSKAKRYINGLNWR